MKQEHREVLVLHEIQELSGEDIARIIDKCEGTVRSRLRLARQEFSRILAIRQGESFRAAAGGRL
jgi:RNA polymerase sigma-70 factor (ECF subfamily)